MQGSRSGFSSLTYMRFFRAGLIPGSHLSSTAACAWPSIACSVRRSGHLSLAQPRLPRGSRAPSAIASALASTTSPPTTGTPTWTSQTITSRSRKHFEGPQLLIRSRGRAYCQCSDCHCPRQTYRSTSSTAESLDFKGFIWSSCSDHSSDARSARMASGSTGLTRWWSKPASRERRRASSSA